MSDEQENTQAVSAAGLVAEDLSKGPYVEASDAATVDAGQLVTEAGSQQSAVDSQQTPVEPVNRAPEYDGHWPASSVGDGDCRCPKCSAGTKNKDSRGRHHAKCPCKLCDLYRGRTSPQGAPAGASSASTNGGDAPSFTDLPGMSGAADPNLVTETATPDYDVMAKLLFDMSTGTLSMALGPEWAPENEAERTNVCIALKAYLAAKGVQDVPPGVLLCFVVIAYSAPRVRKPATANKLHTFSGWVKDRILYPVSRWFKRRRYYSAPEMLEDKPKNQKQEEKQ